MTIRYLFLVSLVCLAILFAGCGASNYDECVLESMKGVTSDVVAKEIIRSCRNKFPEKKPNDTEVSENVVRQLQGRGGISYGTLFKGRIYNGSSEWTITQLTVMLVPKPKDKSSVSEHSPKEYNVDVDVPPLTVGEFMFSVYYDDVASKYDWGITKARGYISR